ncbi:MAG: glycoside hydrolase family 2 TIM barrel-domain containing protein [Verrucomicrobiota bacterium]
MSRASEAAGWRPMKAPLMTRWAAEVSPTNTLPEYPRPQLVRADWLNLNGLWDFAITASNAVYATAYEGKILVPFPIESALSGVKRELREDERLWYRRFFRVPRGWSGRQTRLHFGAVDWEAHVFVNGRQVGRHRGGYDGFTFDVTGFLKQDEENELVVAVTNPIEADRARGKQSRRPQGIFYTPSSGIWQTVWLEPVPEGGIEELKLTPNVSEKALKIRVASAAAGLELRVEAVATTKTGEITGRSSGVANTDFSVPINNPHFWSPDDPFLYDLEIRLMDGERIVDRVSSYFGMREVKLKVDENELTRIAVNDRFVFQIGALDQGFWPDGIYTAPTDAALRSDLDFLKKSGFNLVRKHVKVEPERWYYWCDRIGLLVWQDMPSGNNNTPAACAQFEAELQRMIAGRFNHPSVIMWVLFNEGWGQYDTERLTALVKSLDPSRLVNNASGWTDKHVGDVVDVHSYPSPEATRPEAGRASVLGEFGGLGLVLEGHRWATNTWSYQMLVSLPSWQSWYSLFVQRIWEQRETHGLSAAVYTQTTDVETECNGLLTYDRAVSKLDPAALAAINDGSARVGRKTTILPTAQTHPTVWDYTTNTPAQDWHLPSFDASTWSRGVAGFGTKETRNSIVGTPWTAADIWLRNEFVLGSFDPKAIRLRVHHDENVDVYLNGVLALQLDNFSIGYDDYQISPAAAASLHRGVNTIAVHCHQTSGGQFVDVGIDMVQSRRGQSD